MFTEEERRRGEEREGEGRGGGKEGGIRIYGEESAHGVYSEQCHVQGTYIQAVLCMAVDVSDSLVIQWSKLLTVMAAYRLRPTAVAPHTGT